MKNAMLIVSLLGLQFTQTGWFSDLKQRATKPQATTAVQQTPAEIRVVRGIWQDIKGPLNMMAHGLALYGSMHLTKIVRETPTRKGRHLFASALTFGVLGSFYISSKLEKK